jgi:hypothetical protein
MAEDREKKDDEKLEFDSTGQAIGYISLDQARVLALQHARDNREFYGRYADREITWEELSAEESEDYYRVRLSYRPARGFQGRPGLEQFTIDKAGPIELRQILREPRSSRGLFVGLAVLLVAGMAVGALFASGVLSPTGSPSLVPVPETTAAVSVTLIPGAPAQLVSPLGDVTVDVAAGSLDRPLQLEYQPGFPLLQPPAGSIAGPKVFDLSLTDEQGGERRAILVHETHHHHYPP